MGFFTFSPTGDRLGSARNFRTLHSHLRIAKLTFSVPEIHYRIRDNAGIVGDVETLPTTAIVCVRRRRRFHSPRARVPFRHQEAVHRRTRLARQGDPITHRHINPCAMVRSPSSRRYSLGFRPCVTFTVFPCLFSAPWVEDGDLTWLGILDGPHQAPYLAFEDDSPIVSAIEPV